MSFQNLILKRISRHRVRLIAKIVTTKKKMLRSGRRRVWPFKASTFIYLYSISMSNSKSHASQPTPFPNNHSPSFLIEKKHRRTLSHYPVQALFLALSCFAPTLNTNPSNPFPLFILAFMVLSGFGPPLSSSPNPSSEKDLDRLFVGEVTAIRCFPT